MSRFFKKAKTIDDLTDRKIFEFLSKEKLVGKIQPGRIRDFYNGLSTLRDDGLLHDEDVVDYSQFNCKTADDFQKINQLKSKERSCLGGVNKDFTGEGRILQAATALAYGFEKGMFGGSSDNEDPNSYLRNLFSYHEDQDSPPHEFGEALDMDLKYMRYLALLSQKKAFAKVSRDLKPDPGGNVIRYAPMEGMGDIVNVDMLQYVLPNFDRKLVSQEFYVKKRHTFTDKAQNLLILVDNSSSMTQNGKPEILKAAIVLKLRDYKECHNIYLATFESQLYGFHKVTKKDRFEDFGFITLSQGSTDVNGAVKSTIEQVKSRKLVNRNGGYHHLDDSHFEIMIINDGQDKVDPNFHPQIKIHAMCMYGNNLNLKNVCHRSGGTYYYFPKP
jgi:hypothetical protein